MGASLTSTGTLGLPAGLPSTDYLAINPGEESGEPGLTGSVPVADNSPDYSPLIRWITKQLQLNEPTVQRWRAKAKECYRFRDGKQLSEADEQVLQSSKRPVVAFNAVQKYIKFVGGVQRMTPQALIYLPRSQDDEKAAMRGELLTKMYEYIMGSVNQGHSERSRAFDDMNVAGMGWTNTWASRNRNPRGEIMYGWTDNMQMLWPETSKQNLEGAKWVARESSMPVEEAVNKWPKRAMYIRAAAGTSNDEDQIPDFGYADSRSMIKYVVPWIMTEPLNKTPGAGRLAKPGEVNILEWQYWVEEDGYYFYDPNERDDHWENASTFQKLQRGYKAIGASPITDYDRQMKRVYKNTFLLNRRIMLQEPQNLVIDGNFTYNCMTAHWDSQDKIWYGIMRVLMDPQRMMNVFIRQVVEIMGAQAKGGYDVEAGAVSPSQRTDIEKNSSKPGSVNIWAPGAIAERRMQPKPTPQIPEGSMAVLQFMKSSFDDVSGIATQMFGMGVGNGTPGITLRRQMLGGLLILAGEFDSLTRFRKREGDIIYGFMKLIADGRVVRVGGPEDSQAFQADPELFNDPNFQYDIILDENEHDPTMRQQYSDTVTQILPTLVRMGWFIPELLDYYQGIPWPVKKKLKQAIEQQGQMRTQMQQQGVSIGGRGKPRSAEDAQVERFEKTSKSQLNLAKAMEMRAKTKEMDHEREGRNLRDVFDMIAQGQKMRMERDKMQHDAQQAQTQNLLEMARIQADQMRPNTQG